MSLNSLFSIFLPKEDKFFPNFQKMADEIVEASNLFEELVSEQNKQHQAELYQKIKAIETRCDNITLDIFDNLNNSFVVPFDREDMHQLCDDLDDMMDFINSAAKRIIFYNPKQLPEKSLHMSEIVLQGAKAIRTAFGELKTINKKPKLALDQCAILHDLEHEADDVYDNFVRELFENESDAKELIKLKGIMQSMEDTTDAANRVGKTLKTIMVKYA